MPPPTFEARVLASRALSPSVREITLARSDGAPMAFEPGQWVTLVLPLPAGELRRAYSIASPPRTDGTFEIAVTRVTDGAGSRFLHGVGAGEVLQVVGPQGFFTRAAGLVQPSLFIGTGTGVAPLRSMILADDAIRAPGPLWLLFGGRQEHDLLYGDELHALAARSPGFRLEQTLSRGSPAWAGRRGYVQEHARALYQELAHGATEAPHVYACGLDRMVSAVRELFRQELGLPRQLVHTERYD